VGDDPVEEGTPVTRIVQRGGQPVRVVRSCVVEVLSGADAGLRREVEAAEFVIGTHESNQVVLTDATVSRHHLQVTATPDGYRVTDVGSSNGTYAGALQVMDVRISGPVMLQLGGTTVRLGPGTVEHEVPAATVSEFGPLVGRSLSMRELFAQLEQVAQSDCAVLLQGETGVGKERVAEALHQASARAAGPLVVVDCAALAPGLMESELFGHMRGAFTGASDDRPGLIEQANGGTLFLDEIGELPLTLQAKLLGTLERRQVMRLGTTRSRPVQFRVIAATNRHLMQMVNQGQFRADLFYRLAVVRLRVPPLRERMEDIPLLVGRHLSELRAREGAGVPTELSAVAMAHLYAQPWPGNVRELFNTIEQIALVAAGPAGARDGTFVPYAAARDQFLQEFDQRYLHEALAQCNYNMSETARRTGIERR
jgi:DNA-binding NtrC family response regulator